MILISLIISGLLVTSLWGCIKHEGPYKCTFSTETKSLGPSNRRETHRSVKSNKCLRHHPIWVWKTDRFSDKSIRNTKNNLSLSNHLLRMVVEPKYYAEEVIGHLNHHLRIWSSGLAIIQETNTRCFAFFFLTTFFNKNPNKITKPFPTHPPPTQRKTRHHHPPRHKWKCSFFCLAKYRALRTVAKACLP